MFIGEAFAPGLPASHRQALNRAAEVLVDMGYEDLLHSDDRAWRFADGHLARYLPPACLPRYTLRFIRKFHVCLITVAWKLAQPAHMRLSCVAEELAAYAIIREAEVILEEEEGEEADFSELESELFEDADFELLFAPAFDGIDQSRVGKAAGMTSLAFQDWFKPFGEDQLGVYPSLHPFALDNEAP